MTPRTTLKSISPCDCSLIPMSPKEVGRVFTGQLGPQLRKGLHTALRYRGGMDKPVVCPGCGEAWESGAIR